MISLPRRRWPGSEVAMRMHALSVKKSPEQIFVQKGLVRRQDFG